MRTPWRRKTLQTINPESMAISEHMAELPESVLAASRMLRTTSPELASSYTASLPIVGVQTVSLAAFAVMLSGYRLKAEITAGDGQVAMRLMRREDAEVAA